MLIKVNFFIIKIQYLAKIGNSTLGWEASFHLNQGFVKGEELCLFSWLAVEVLSSWRLAGCTSMNIQVKISKTKYLLQILDLNYLHWDKNLF